MPQYIIYFNRQWVGDHSDEWFASRGALANAVVEEIKAAGAYVFAAGVDQDIDGAFSADATGDSVVVRRGRVAPGEAFLGGLTIVDVVDEDAAKLTPFCTGLVDGLVRRPNYWAIRSTVRCS